MSIQEKIDNAKPTTWPADGIPKWRVRLIVFFAKLKARLKKRKQTCFVYCPRCKNELVSSNSFVEDKDGIVKYKCDKCGNVSFWDFAYYPVPYLRTCASDCEHFAIEDTYYGCTRKGACDPDSMVEFKQRWWKVKCEEETNEY